MIQRIQTLYLLGIIALVVLSYYLPMAELFNTAGQNDWYSLRGLSSGKAGQGLNEIITFLSGMVVGASLITIFLYKRRKGQMRACILLIIVLVLMNVLLFIQIGLLKQALGMMANYKFASVLPLVAAVLAFMAYRAIKKDEDLVKSYDRLR